MDNRKYLEHIKMKFKDIKEFCYYTATITSFIVPKHINIKFLKSCILVDFVFRTKDLKSLMDTVE